jgi:hypothetical protein
VDTFRKGLAAAFPQIRQFRLSAAISSTNARRAALSGIAAPMTIALVL